jgi:hypothetical protein
MDNLSNDSYLTLDNEYSAAPLEYNLTKGRRDPLEEWQATGW